MDEFCTDLLNQILCAVSAGARRFIFWGFNENCLRLLAEMERHGIREHYISGIVDSRPEVHGSDAFGYRVHAPGRVGELPLDTLVVTSDAEKVEALRQFARHDCRVPRVIFSGSGHFAFQDPVFDEILASCLVKSYANGYENSLIHLYQAIHYLAHNKIIGAVAEFGIFKGGTIVFIAEVLERLGLGHTKIYGFDIFEGFPPSRSVLDLYRNPKCEFRDAAAVEAYCGRHGIEVVKGDICDTYRRMEGVPLMLSFFDTDNYSPTRSALECCFEQTVKGGVLAFDHYVSEPRFIDTIGERIAAQEVLEDKNVLHLHGTGLFLKL